MSAHAIRSLVSDPPGSCIVSHRSLAEYLSDMCGDSHEYRTSRMAES